MNKIWRKEELFELREKKWKEKINSELKANLQDSQALRSKRVFNEPLKNQENTQKNVIFFFHSLYNVYTDRDPAWAPASPTNKEFSL